MVFACPSFLSDCEPATDGSELSSGRPSSVMLGLTGMPLSKLSVKVESQVDDRVNLSFA